MSLIVTLLVMTLVTGCWSSPQRRNWTPQAILYLKGAQGHRSVLQRTSREEGDTFHIMTHNQRSSDGPGSSLSSILLELLQRAVAEGKHTESHHQHIQQSFKDFCSTSFMKIYFLPQVEATQMITQMNKT
ncbi:spexin prohormone 1-like [Sebastes umbrosus]|uniref:spexin prohormone 1-like n=1 Tax=Sebastes umbrosus TaxID=72105 RepID=UPI00189D36F9|nr:spexin prohormone 1-like [Sebastes umbrosus]